MSHTPFPHISEFNPFFGVYYFSTQTPISPICRTPLFPISQNLILSFGAESFISPPRQPISPICRTPLSPISQYFNPFSARHRADGLAPHLDAQGDGAAHALVEAAREAPPASAHGAQHVELRPRAQGARRRGVVPGLALRSHRRRAPPRVRTQQSARAEHREYPPLFPHMSQPVSPICQRFIRFFRQVNVIETDVTPPTHFKLNKFTASFQAQEPRERERTLRNHPRSDPSASTRSLDP